MKPSNDSLRTLLIISEIVIPLIVFYGAYRIFKPIMQKKNKDVEEEKGEADKG